MLDILTTIDIHSGVGIRTPMSELTLTRTYHGLVEAQTVITLDVSRIRFTTGITTTHGIVLTSIMRCHQVQL